MESASNFEEAKQLLSSTQLIAPVYFILAGNTSEQVNGFKLNILQIQVKPVFRLLHDNSTHPIALTSAFGCRTSEYF